MYKKTLFTYLIVIGLLIHTGFRVDKSFAGHGNQEYWPTKEWRTSTPESQGMDSTQLKKMNDFLENECRMIRSVLVVRNGYVVFEKYYNGGEVNIAQPIYSATKSIVSALIGIALDKGYIKNIDQKMITFFPGYASHISDQRVKTITIRHLLTMTAGFPTSFRGRPGMQSSFSESIVTEPGLQAAYNGSASNLLSGIISNSTKTSTLEFGYEHLFKPLGIDKPPWGKGINGYIKGSYGLSMRSRDMAKIGYLYLQNGVWDNNQIIPEKWVKESTQKGSAMLFSPQESPYGYQWWVIERKGHSAFQAAGIGGQYIIAIPDLDIVMVSTSNNYYSTGTRTEHYRILEAYIIPAVIQK